MKKNILILIVLSIFSCKQDNEYLITTTSIGKYKLNNILIEDYNKEEFDFKTDSENKITSILTYSNKFKTKDDFGVGSNFRDIKVVNDDNKEGEMTLSKGDNYNMAFGKTLVNNNILFIDTNEDKIVDLVWVSN